MVKDDQAVLSHAYITKYTALAQHIEVLLRLIEVGHQTYPCPEELALVRVR